MLMSDPKYWRSKYVVEILSYDENPTDYDELQDLALDNNARGNVGNIISTSHVELTVAEMEEALRAQHSDPECLIDEDDLSSMCSLESITDSGFTLVPISRLAIPLYETLVNAAGKLQ